MIELLKQYVDSGSLLSEYQVNKLLENKNLLIKYLRKRTIPMHTDKGFWTDYEEEIIKNGIKNNLFSENLLIDLVKSDNKISLDNFIKYIENPSEDVQLASVQKSPTTIAYIKNPSEQVQLAAVQKYGRTIQIITLKGIEPSEKVQLAAVKQDDSSIEFISNPYPSVINYIKSLEK